MISIEEAQRLRAGRKLVFTNGVFDVLHAGHVRYLAHARSLGDMLIVGLNTDASVRRLGKGDGRPVNPLEDRSEVLEGLRSVDATVAFDEDNPSTLISLLRPDIHVKGGDYDPDAMPETPIIRAYGGEIVIVPLVPGRSTTATLKRLGLE